MEDERAMDEERVKRELEELEKLSLDLFLDDVEVEWPGSKRGLKYRGRGGRILRGRGRSRWGRSRGRGRWDKFGGSNDDDMFDIDSNERKWDLEKKDSAKDDDMFLKGRFHRGKSFVKRSSHFDDGFDIEESSVARERSPGFGRAFELRSWSRESRESAGRRSDDNLDTEDLPQKDPRLGSRDPRLKTSTGSNGSDRPEPNYKQRLGGESVSVYESLRKDSRFMALQDKQRKEVENLYAPGRSDPRLASSKKDLRMTAGSDRSSRERSRGSPIPGLGPPGVESDLPGLNSEDRESSRKGPRSPPPVRPPSPPPVRKRSPGWSHDRGGSPSRHRSRWERSPSPLHGRRGRSSSPWRHRQDASERRDRRSGSREWRERSPRRRRSSLSNSPPRRSSLDPRVRLSSPSPRRDSASRDGMWRASPASADVRPMQPPPYGMPSFDVMATHPPPVYNESGYGNNMAQTGPPPATGPQYGNSTSNYPPGPYQQYPGYDNYYQQPQASSYTGEYNQQSGNNWPEGGGMVYQDTSHVQMGSSAPTGSSVDLKKAEELKKEAVQNELIQQKQTLAKQREEYVKKSMAITRELNLLKKQEEELLNDNSRDSKRILKENHKLQLEIQNKLKAINNVIDMLTGIIGDEKDIKDEGKSNKKKRPRTPSESPPKSDTNSGERGSSTKVKGEENVSGEKPVYNYVYYDPEMHWCRVCNAFPRTAKEFLNHLHSAEHKNETTERKLVDMPWHKLQSEEEVPIYKGAPSKRTPIRGLQFFISATAWYCKLCNSWIGDLHCASLHLKSKKHSENYAKFTEQNPHWETDWLADREKAYERRTDDRRRLSGNLGTNLIPLSLNPKEKMIRKEKKKKDRKPNLGLMKDDLGVHSKKKKKKSKKKTQDSSGSSSSHSGSSSSGSSGEESDVFDKSKSIRTVMRAKQKMAALHQKDNPNPTMTIKLIKSRWDSPDREPEVSKREISKHSIVKETLDKDVVDVVREIEELKKKSTLKPFRSTTDDKLLKEWMTTPKDVVSEGEKQALNNIKERVKLKQEADRERDKEGDRKKDERDRYYHDKASHEERRDSKDPKKQRRTSRSPHGDSPFSRKKRNIKSPIGRWDRMEKTRYEKHESDRHPEKNKRSSPPRSRQDKQDSKTNEVESKIPEKIDKNEDVSSKFKTSAEKKAAAVAAATAVVNRLKKMEEEEEETAESKFEKQTAESAVKKGKKPPILTIPKSKLPFIGRMPILKNLKNLTKKKGPSGDKADEDEKSLEELSQKEQEDLQLIMRAKLQQEDNGVTKDSTEQLQPSNAEVQDMDIDDDDNSNHEPGALITETVPQPTEVNVQPIEQGPQLYESVQVSYEVAEEPTPKKQVNEIPLPKDFQDALNILFPSQGENGEKEEGVTPGQNAEGSIPHPHDPNMWGQPGLPPGQNMMPMNPQGMMPGYQGAPQMMGPGPRPMMPPQQQGPMHGPPQGMQGMHGPPGMQGGPMMSGPSPPQGMFGPPGMMGPQGSFGMMGPRMHGPGPPMGPHGPPGPRGPMPGPPHGPLGPRGPPGPPRGPPGPPTGPPCGPIRGPLGPRVPHPAMLGVSPLPPHPSRSPPPDQPKKKVTSPSPHKETAPPARKGQMSKEDLLMLGIDAEDMAAQAF